MSIEQKIKNELIRALSDAGVKSPEPMLEFPADLTHGDWSTNAAFVYGKELHKNPRAFAEEVVAKLGAIEHVSKIEIAGAGFINFHLAPEYFSSQIKEIIAKPEGWGRGNLYAGKKVVIEYTDPNPFKEFHIGHLMSNTIGESLARLIENAGANVVRANYQGDVGIHVASAIWGMKKLRLDPKSADDFGRAYAAGATAYKEDESAKKEIEEINKKLYERSDPELGIIYDTGRKSSLDAFERIYAILGTKFDHYFFESETGPIGKKIIEEHPEIFEASEGALVFRGEKYDLHTRVFVNSQGLPTYEAKELGLQKMKADLYPDASMFLVVTGNEIIDYFKVVKKALGLIYPDIAAKLMHVPHGMMRLATGKMSSRTGRVITGESLISDLTEAALERAKESRAEDKKALAQKVAVAAVKYQVLKQAIGRDSVFDEARALSLEGDSGPYLQYAHARTRALLEKASEAGITPDATASIYGGSHTVVRMLMRFPYIAERAVKEYAPHYVVSYLTDLAGAFNAWYAKEQILDGTSNASRKLAIVSAVTETLKNGLHLLGMEAPDRM